MNPDDIRFDSEALERWLNEGGYCPPDAGAAESHRLSLSQLREWVALLTENRNDAWLLLEIMRGEISFADFAASLGLHRSNGKRRIEKFLTSLQRRLAACPDLLAQLPNPWRRLILGE